MPSSRKRMQGLVAVLVILVGVIAIGGWMRISQKNGEANSITNTEVSTNTNQAAENVVRLTINNSTATSAYDMKVESEVIVLDLLKQAGTEQGFSVGIKSYDFGDMVEEIAGVKNDAATQTYWSFKVNGTFSNEGASTAKAKAGDSVEWIYTNAAY